MTFPKHNPPNPLDKVRLPPPLQYREYRAQFWEKQPREGYDWHGSQFNGVAIDHVAFEPARNVFLKDVWHCKDHDQAREQARLILAYEDVLNLEVKGRFVFVTFFAHGYPTALPGQVIDSRSRQRGSKFG